MANPTFRRWIVRYSLVGLMAGQGILLVPSCGPRDPGGKQAVGSEMTSKLFSRLDPAASGVHFVNDLTETDSVSFFGDIYFYNGAGVGAGDINNDGLPDLFFAANQRSSRLYLNRGGLVFEDITEKAGVTTTRWCKGVAMADVDGDGWLDIYVSCSSPFKSTDDRRNLLFINNHDNTFTERAAAFGLDDPGYASQSYFFDADLDNDLDVYVVNHARVNDNIIATMADENARIDPYITGRFYRNDNGVFHDRTREAGLSSNTFGLSAMINDFNLDGFPDIYACNDFKMPDFVYINKGNGTFIDQTDKYIRHMSRFSMGSDAADYNNDGLVDLYVVDMFPEDNYRHKMLAVFQNYDRQDLYIRRGYRDQRLQNCLQLNNGNGTFSDVAMLADVYRTDWSWAALFADFDNDGWKDIYVANGIYRDIMNLDFMVYKTQLQRQVTPGELRTRDFLGKMTSTRLKDYLFRNNRDLTFSKANDTWGIDEQRFSYGAAYADLDNDGDLDLVINCIADTAGIYINGADRRPDNRYLRINLSGPPGNTAGIGTAVHVHQSAGQQLQLVYPSRGYLSSVSTVLHFGLGADTLADSVTVRFPDGRGKVIRKVASGSTVDVAYAGAVPLPMPRLPDAGGRPVFENVTAGTGAAFRHRENDFIDFKREPFLPHKFSGAGPGIATGDVNGDGLEDFYIGNARGSAGSLFLQTPGGTFRPGPSQPWTADRMQEDDDCLLFDADNDGDLDLYVVSGGSEENQTSPYYQDRLYRNDGQGRFSRCTTCLPEIRISGSCITAADFDGDGDLDLFRGGRIGPGQYPLPVANYLLRNDNGTFTDVIGTAAPDLQRPAGLVTAAVWSDFSGDGRPDLVVTGEWMPVLFFENTGGVLQHAGDRETDEHNRGWWNALAAVDVDGDGDTDYIAGNYGLNLRLTASPARPLRVYANDFDSSGTVDAVICNYEPDGRSYPIYSREDFTDQIRSYKSKLLRYADYAGKTIEELIPQPLLGNSFVLSATNMATCIVRNDGGGRFTYVPLPVEAQISPVFGIVTGDFDGDGRQDLLLGGNSFSESFDMGNCDCGNGLFLAGDGRGGFEPLPARRSGFVASRDVKAMKAIRRPGGKTFILVGNNNDGLQVFATAEQGHVEARR